MTDNLSAAVVCGSVFLRDVVAENLHDRGVRVLYAASSFSEIPSECQPQILVVIETSPGELETPKEGSASLARRFQKWLIIGPSEHGSMFQRLRATRSDVSGVPLDIGKDEIYHAVILAARSSAMCIGDSFLSNASTELHRLNHACLDKGQWRILRMLADGATNKQIAQAFECEEGQVKGMIRRLLNSINANNRTQAAVIAARAGL